MKPARFCWECGNKLHGNHYAMRSIDGHQRTLHKQCASEIDAGYRDSIPMDHEIKSELREIE